MHSIIAVAVFGIAYLFIATEKFPRVPTALVGAGLLFAAGVTHANDAFFSEETGVDWNVIFLLLGMMIIVGVISRTGLFAYLGVRVVQTARGKPLPIMTLLVIVTAVASALLDNVTTVLLIAPVTLSLCSRLRLKPVPFLLAEVFASNLGGAATLIGDPPNIIIASRAGLSFNDFLVHLAPVALVGVLILIAMLPRLFRGAFTADLTLADEMLRTDPSSEITNHPLLVRSMIILGLVLLGFVLQPVIHTEPAIVALLGAGVLMMLSRLTIEECIEDVEWETLVFFMALFIMVGALVKVGVIEHLANLAADGAEGRIVLATLLLLVVSAVVSGIVDNIPYVAAMGPLVGRVISESSTAHGISAMWWALAIGADFGGNATAVGASANVVMLGIARKAGHPISFWDFTKKGLVVTAATTAIAVPYVWLRYFVLG